MTAAILQSSHYERLADQCDLRGDLTRLTEERDFYRKQASIFRKLAKVKQRRDAAEHSSVPSAPAAPI